MASKLINLVALSSLVILACSFGATPVNALSLDVSPNHAARHLGHHQVIAKKKRAESRRCKPRPSSSSAVPVSSAVKPSSSSVKPVVIPTSSKAPVVVQPVKTTPKPTPTPTPTPQPAPPASNSGSKVGLAWSDGSPSDLKNFKTNKVSAIYNWSPNKVQGADAVGLEYVPMLWGTKQISSFQNLVKAGYARHVLGFNEPDHDGQAALDPGYAASLWKQYIQPLKNQGYTLISPAVTSGASGVPWLQSFFGACSGCSVDILAVHWYGTDPNNFISYLNQMHTTFGRPIWVTEFACQNFSGGAQCSESQVNNFMDTVTAFMDKTDWVQKYFAFGVQHNMVGVNSLNQLMAGNGQPTALGQKYIN